MACPYKISRFLRRCRYVFPCRISGNSWVAVFTTATELKSHVLALTSVVHPLRQYTWLCYTYASPSCVLTCVSSGVLDMQATCVGAGCTESVGQALGGCPSNPALRSVEAHLLRDGLLFDRAIVLRAERSSASTSVQVGFPCRDPVSCLFTPPQ